ncbi:hypothetical protein [Bacterioplanoides sp.]|uniref:hypothetical protein n=1 Tax=Bacterioplanoides sp. TaxID=2066072 RepID=UPI003B59EA01
MKPLKEYLRKAKDIIFSPVTGIADKNVQSAIETAYKKGDEALTAANSKINQSEGDARYIQKSSISTATDSTSTATVSASLATKETYDHAAAAHKLISSKDTEYQSTFEKLANRNKSNGYAGLDSAGLLSPNQIPGQTIVNVFVYDSTAERNAYTKHHMGDMAIIEGSGGTASLYILKVDPAGSATTDDDWLILQTNVTVDVHSWNKRNGDVMPALGDYSTDLIFHDEEILDGYLTNLEASIPKTAGDLNAYNKTEVDGRFVNKSVVSDSVTSDSSTDVASSKAAKTAYDRGTTALNTANSKLSEEEANLLYLGINAKAKDSALLNGQNESFYRNASNLNSGTVPNARLPSTAIRSDNQIKDIAGAMANGSQTRITVTYDSANKAYAFVVDVQSEQNFTGNYKSKLDKLLPNHWKVVTGNTTAANGDRIMVDMDSIGTLTVNLPSSPSAGHTVMVADGTGLAGQGKQLTIGRNGTNIMSLSEDMNVDVPGYLMTFVYMNSTRGWVVMN